MRQQCTVCDGWFDPDIGPCSNFDGGELCGNPGPEPEVIGPRKRAVDHVGSPTADDLAAMTDEQRDRNLSGIELVRRAAAEAAYRKQLPDDIRELMAPAGVDDETGEVR